VKTIVLSAGHGGSDPGAIGNGLRESDCNLAITLACRDHLNHCYTGHKLVLPRDSDKYVSLPFRRDLAAKERASLYVSMHNNAFNTPAPRGFETFISSGEVYEFTRKAQQAIHNKVYAALRAKDPTVPNRGMKRAVHWVTSKIMCPVVLVEYLFITSPTDAALLRQNDFLKQLGVATAEGIAEALQLPKKVTAPPPIDTGIFYRVVVGSYNDRANAIRVAEEAKAKGFSGAFILPFRRGE